MPFQPSCAEAARWITKDADMVAYVEEEILRAETWWMAARSRKYAHPIIRRADESATGAANSVGPRGHTRKAEHPAMDGG